MNLAQVLWRSFLLPLAKATDMNIDSLAHKDGGTWVSPQLISTLISPD